MWVDVFHQTSQPDESPGEFRRSLSRKFKWDDHSVRVDITAINFITNIVYDNNRGSYRFNIGISGVPFLLEYENNDLANQWRDILLDQLIFLQQNKKGP